MTRHSAVTITGLALIVAMRWGTDVGRGAGPTTAPTFAAKAPADAEHLKAWWADLEKGEPMASRALLSFADHPAESVAFLKDRLRPLTLSADDLETLLSALGSDDQHTWQGAFEQLAYLDPRLAKDLPALMGEVTDKVVRTRLVEILSDYPPGHLAGKDITLRTAGKDAYNFFDGRASWWAEHKIERISSRNGWGGTKAWTRAERAVVLLEHIGTPEAMEIVKRMATGHPDAGPTKVAKEVVERGKTAVR